MGKTEKLLVGAALAGAAMNVQAQTQTDTTNESVKEQAVSGQNKSGEYLKLKGYAAMLQIPSENIGEITSVGDLTRNVYTNSKGQKVEQNFSHVKGWTVLNETTENSHVVKARKGNTFVTFKQKDYDFMDGKESYVSGEYAEKIGDREFKAFFSGNPESNKSKDFSVNSDDFVSLQGIQELLTEIIKAHKENQAIMDKAIREGKTDLTLASENDAKGGISMAFYKDLSR